MWTVPAEPPRPLWTPSSRLYCVRWTSIGHCQGRPRRRQNATRGDYPHQACWRTMRGRLQRCGRRSRNSSVYRKPRRVSLRAVHAPAPRNNQYLLRHLRYGYAGRGSPPRHQPCQTSTIRHHDRALGHCYDTVHTYRHAAPSLMWRISVGGWFSRGVPFCLLQDAVRQQESGQHHVTAQALWGQHTFHTSNMLQEWLPRVQPSPFCRGRWS